MKGGDHRENVGAVCRRLLELAYPDKSASWVDEQVTLAVIRVRRSAMTESATTTASLPPWSIPVPDTRHGMPGRVKWLAGLIGVAVPLAVVVVHFVLYRSWITVLRPSELTKPLIGLSIVTAGATAYTYIRSRREKVLSVRVWLDTKVEFDVGDLVRLQRPDNTAVKIIHPSMVVLRIKNTSGRPIGIDDYSYPLLLRFPERRVVSVDVTESTPPELQDIIPNDPTFQVSSDRIMLPNVPLNPDEAFKMVVLLSSARPHGPPPVAIDCSLNQGRITTKPDEGRIKRPTLITGVLASVIIGALVIVLMLSNATGLRQLPEGVACVPGKLTVQGSSAFALGANQVAGAYRTFCPDSIIQVNATNSGDGVKTLVAEPDPRVERLAIYDGPAPASEAPGLVGRPIAIVPFAIVVNTGKTEHSKPDDVLLISNLTSDDIRKIFSGEYSNWGQVTGRSADEGKVIHAVGRVPKSGTRQSLERSVLRGIQGGANSTDCLNRDPGKGQHILCEQRSTDELLNKVAAIPYTIGYADLPDVERFSSRPIPPSEKPNSYELKQVTLDGQVPTRAGVNTGYPFWAIEYLYSKDPLPPGSLAESYVKFFGTKEAGKVIDGVNYFACFSDRKDRIKSLCRGEG